MPGVPGHLALGSDSAHNGGSGRPPSEGATIELELDPGPSAAAEARAALSLLQGRTDAEALDDVRLLVSELVTNSVRHSAPPAGSKVELTVSATPDIVRVTVTDAGRGFDPTPRSAPRTKAGGWGLHLVDRLADRWGVDRSRGAAVWFELDAAR
jgi:anti-sigma regulatory factor (Ser/Thr protein kinase)